MAFAVDGYATVTAGVEVRQFDESLEWTIHGIADPWRMADQVAILRSRRRSVPSARPGSGGTPARRNAGQASARSIAT